MGCVVSFRAGSRIRELRVYLVCDQDGDCRGSPQGEWLLFRTEGDEFRAGSMFNIDKNQFVTFSGYMHVGDNENVFWRFNKVIAEWVSEEGVQYNGRAVMRILDRSPQLLVDCKIAPSSVLATQQGAVQGATSNNNDIVLCNSLSNYPFKSTRAVDASYHQ